MRFSVIVPVFNREKYIRQAVDSVLSQDFSSYELIVVDDGSSDHTPDEIRSYGGRLSFIRQENKGPVAARSNGIARATGEYLVFLDSDDILLPHALETYDRIIKGCASPAVILGAMSYFDDDKPVRRDADSGSGIEVVQYRDYLSKDRGLGMSFSKIVLRRSVYEQAVSSRNDVSTVFPMEDHDLLLQVGTAGPCVLVVRPRTVAYRVHAGNYVHNIEAMVKGTLSLVRVEREGRYPGGRKRRFARYAYIGSKVRFWTWQTLSARRPLSAAKLLRSGGFMMAFAALRNIRLKLNRKTPTLVLRG
jgi:glycosyltransferase involved in cell wall biosynthesis